MHEDRIEESRSDGPRPVVILNMHYTGLGIARNLAGTGAEVFGLSFDKSFFGNYTRHCRFLVSPDTENEPEACRDFLLQLSSRVNRRPLLFATRDHDIDFVLRFRPDLERAFVIPYPSSDTLSTIMNKDRLFARAKEIGIRCPRGWVIQSSDELRRFDEEITFPCIIKPVRSTQWRQRDVWDVVRQKVVKADTRDELWRFYEKVEPHDPLVQVEEYIPGPDTHLTIFGSYRNPRSGVLRYFTARKLLQYPPGSGTGVAVQGRRIPDIIEMSKRILEKLDYFGVSELEYKLDQRDGTYALIEMNPRHWDQHRLGASCGVNLSRIAYADLMEGNVVQATQIDRQIGWIAEEGYVRSFVSNFRTRSYPISTYLAALRGRMVLAVFDIRDPGPAFRMIGSLVRQSIRRILGLFGSKRDVATQ